MNTLKYHNISIEMQTVIKIIASGVLCLAKKYGLVKDKLEKDEKHLMGKKKYRKGD